MSSRKTVPAEARNIVMVPLGKLKKSPKNVRKVPHTDGEIAALAASIASVGMLQFPVIEPELGPKHKPTGNFLVNAGEGRRLAQLLRAKRKEIAKDEPIPCVIDTEHSATEISLAENTIRSNMHPADEFEAFAELNQKEGMSPEDIAGRYGVTAAVVKQRLKLGAVSPSLLTLYREGEMNLDQLTAFAITDDHVRQEQVWAELGWDKSRQAILWALTEGQVAADDRRVSFIGLEAYEAAGGTVIRDLFDEDDGGYLTDAPLLTRLVREKLQRLAETVMAEGWKWVQVDVEYDYQRTASMATIDTVPRPLSDEEQQQFTALQEELERISNEAEENGEAEDTYAEIERLEAEIAKFSEETFLPEGIARAGAFVALGNNGEARIERGYLRPEDVKIKEGEGGADGKPASQTAKEADGLSAALTAELTAHRTAALQNDLAQAPDLALIAVTHALTAKAFYRFADVSCLGLSLNEASLSGAASDIADSIAGKAIAERHAAWEARMPESGEALWAFVASLAMNELLALLAHCASLSLDAVQRPGSHSRGAALTHADTLAKAMPHDMTRYWQPTVANYLGRVSKERILEAVREARGEDEARHIAGLKKQAMAELAEQSLSGENWLPPLLRPAPSAEQADA
ncbi:ParB N-terminal domain-containing protein [Bradyrhizobium sp. CCGUVB1N3]|uniref:ParB/RepB/Spo0J family partition protein n=1 Tax=Bradyrhizobium sp. CCGUVB1N3 TaxID=2949629 RepID=UPI0020B43DE4|nr:ParB N-terminal domain-containing protein [Bradyrhizobium sp. CCGUVB1N3]MCP3476679.1 ParB N-terminal domain-containing protein [Bradyrhizobium sp. CCGUVB1N3]